MNRQDQVYPIRFSRARVVDARALAELHNVTAEDLTAKHGEGPWSTVTSEAQVLRAMRSDTVYAGWSVDQHLIGTFHLNTKKPWAIDPAYFTPCQRPLYLTAMAIHPDHQRRGYGRLALDCAIEFAKAWPADALRLDAYDDSAGG
ncbi:MAG TPA: GNAT family N-acetyltransferase, partial [Verrucomicrobiae bacterium]